VGFLHSIGADASKSQIQPWTETDGYNTVGNPCVNEAGTVSAGASQCFSANAGADAIALRNRAKALGTYYAYGTCPSAAQLTGQIVYIEGRAGGCPYNTGSNTWNSATNPGMIVMGKFADQDDLTIGGSNVYYGLIYDANETFAPDGLHIWITSTAQVFGALVAEWGAGVTIDSTASPALTYDPRAFNAASTGGAPKIVQGTFREVPPGS
jgi:hypothetical protein